MCFVFTEDNPLVGVLEPTVNQAGVVSWSPGDGLQGTLYLIKNVLLMNPVMSKIIIPY